MGNPPVKGPRVGSPYDLHHETCFIHILYNVVSAQGIIIYMIKQKEHGSGGGGGGG